MMKKYFLMIKNREIDGRYFLFGSHVTLLIFSFLFINIQRKAAQIVASLLTAVLVEFFYYKITSKYKDQNFSNRFLSAITIGIGLIILIKSNTWLFFVLMSSIAISIKYLVTYDGKKHVFNPTNASIVVALALFPNFWFEPRTDEFMMSWYPMVHVTIIGGIATWLGKTWIVSISYIFSVLILGFLFFPINNLESAVHFYGPEFGAIGIIFLWQMITDPKTAPVGSLKQVAYAFLIASLHLFMRSQTIIFSRYIALFIVTLIFYIYGNFRLQSNEYDSRRNYTNYVK